MTRLQSTPRPSFSRLSRRRFGHSPRAHQRRRLQSQPAARIWTKGSKILIRSLSVALSIDVVASPRLGFNFLDDLLTGGDRATRRIVTAKLGNARLANAFPTQTARLKGWNFEMDDRQRGR